MSLAQFVIEVFCQAAFRNGYQPVVLRKYSSRPSGLSDPLNETGTLSRGKNAVCDLPRTRFRVELHDYGSED